MLKTLQMSANAEKFAWFADPQLQREVLPRRDTEHLDISCPPPRVIWQRRTRSNCRSNGG